MTLCPSRAPATASGTSGRSRSAATRCASSSASSSRSGSASGAGWPAAARPGRRRDIAIWAVPFGLVGGRLYHVITDYQLYFGEGRRPDHRALHLAGRPRHLGRDRARCARRRSSAPGAWGSGSCRSLTRWRPGVLVAQAIGRWGNWFNQELFGKPTDLPWALEIDLAHRPDGLPRRTRLPPDVPLRVAVVPRRRSPLVIWVDRRFRLGHGRVFALYVMVYTAGRGWIENLRIDDVQLDDVLGLRLNVWTSIVLFVAAGGVLRGVARGATRAARTTSTCAHRRRDEDHADDTTRMTAASPTGESATSSGTAASA